MDGCVIRSVPGAHPVRPGGIAIICESPDKADKLIAAARKVVEPIAIEKSTTCVKVKIYSKPLARWLGAHFGKYAHGKTLPGWVYGMSET